MRFWLWSAVVALSRNGSTGLQASLVAKLMHLLVLLRQQQRASGTADITDVNNSYVRAEDSTPPIRSERCPGSAIKLLAERKKLRIVIRIQLKRI